MSGVCVAARGRGSTTTNGRSNLVNMPVLHCVDCAPMRSHPRCLCARLTAPSPMATAHALLRRHKRALSHKWNLQAKITRARPQVAQKSAGARARAAELRAQQNGVPRLQPLTRCLLSVGAGHKVPTYAISHFLACPVQDWRARDATASSHLGGKLTHCELEPLRCARPSEFAIVPTAHHSALTVHFRSSQRSNGSARRSIRASGQA